MSDGGNALNPIDDVKGAAKFLRGLHPERQITEALEAAARVLEPGESDLRVVVPEDIPTTDRDVPGDELPPGHGSVTLDAAARQKLPRGH